MKFLSLLTILIFGFSNFSYAQTGFPGSYQVDPSQSGGVNVRSGPGGRYPVIAAIPAGKPVTVYSSDRNGNWGQISWNGLPAWIYLGLMEPAGTRHSSGATTSVDAQAEIEVEVEMPEPIEGLTAVESAAQAEEKVAAAAAAAAQISGITCEGVAPNWSARITGDRDFVFLDGDNPPQHRIVENAGTSMNSPNIQMFVTLDYTGVLRGGQCNNGLTGKDYSLVLDLIFNDGDNAKLYSGCCSISGN